jgi:hypothetical protein
LPKSTAVAPVKPLPVIVTLSPPSALPLAGEIAVTCTVAVVGGPVGTLGGPDRCRPDWDEGDPQASCEKVSPPWAEQLDALLLEVPDPPGAALEGADPLGTALEVADSFSPALEIGIVGLEAPGPPHATEAVARHTAPAAIRITVPARWPCHRRRLPALRRIHATSPPPDSNTECHTLILRRYLSRG